MRVRIDFAEKPPVERAEQIWQAIKAGLVAGHIVPRLFAATSTEALASRDCNGCLPASIKMHWSERQEWVCNADHALALSVISKVLIEAGCALSAEVIAERACSMPAPIFDVVKNRSAGEQFRAILKEFREYGDRSSPISMGTTDMYAAYNSAISAINRHVGANTSGGMPLQVLLERAFTEAFAGNG